MEIGIEPEAKVFVANPKKPPQIEGILRRNKEKLLVSSRISTTTRRVSGNSQLISL
jgi:hypothetical protein